MAVSNEQEEGQDTGSGGYPSPKQTPLYMNPRGIILRLYQYRLTCRTSSFSGHNHSQIHITTDSQTAMQMNQV